MVLGIGGFVKYQYRKIHTGLDQMITNIDAMALRNTEKLDAMALRNTEKLYQLRANLDANLDAMTSRNAEMLAQMDMILGEQHHIF